jgi:predicted MFS family arabinose efflux permease
VQAESVARPRLYLLLLALSTFFAVTTEMLPVGLLPQIGRSFSLPPTAEGVLVFMYAAVVAGGAVPLGLFAGRLPLKVVLVFTMGVYVVSDVLMLAGGSYFQICVARAIGGFAHALFFPVVSAYVSRLLAADRLGRGIAFVWSGASVAFVLGVPLSTAVGVALGWRAASGLLAVGTLLLGVGLLVALPRVGQATIGLDAGSGAFWRGGLPLVSVATVLGFFGNYLLYTFVAPLLLRAGASEATVSPCLLLFGACGVAGLWLTGRFTDTAPRSAFLSLLALAVVATGCLAVVTGSLLATVVAASAWSVAFGTMSTFFTVASLRTRSASSVVTAATNNSASNVGIALGAVVGGTIYQVLGVPAVAATSAGLLFVCLLAVFASKRAFPNVAEAPGRSTPGD